MECILIGRFFMLQVLNGQAYASEYRDMITRRRTLTGLRGRILDRNGMELAYNRMVYDAIFTDNGIYESNGERNRELNRILYEVIQILRENGDEINNTFGILRDTDGSYSFRQSGQALQRFRADVFGHRSLEELGYNETLNLREDTASEEEILEYLYSLYGIAVDSEEDAYELAVLRYAMAQNSYQRYMATTLAEGISEKSVAEIEERTAMLPGITVEESSERVYGDTPWFAHITGYTGIVSEEELEQLQQSDSSYEASDTVGKAGIEQVMELQLQGEKTSRTVYVDSLGRVRGTEESEAPKSGEDVYLSVDAGLQEAVYHLLEQQLAGILYSHIENVSHEAAAEAQSASDIVISIEDVYAAMLENHVITVRALADAPEGMAARIYAVYEQQKAFEIERIGRWLEGEAGGNRESESAYAAYILQMLNRQDVLTETEEEGGNRENAEEEGLAETLRRAVEEGRIAPEMLDLQEAYTTSEEIYAQLCAYILEELDQDEEFSILVFTNLIYQGTITGEQIGMAAMELGAVPYSQEEYEALQNGSESAYNWFREKIRSLQLTPAQLGLDPCTGSCVILDVNTGEVLACVTYPGYDANRLANGVDGDYYNALLSDRSLPLYNNALQQRTAPGSTFKPVTAAAALAEGIITPETEIEDRGIFTQITPSPSCWAYPGALHGSINVSEAIRDSCNYFFYEMGYEMSLENGVYTPERGIRTLEEYARLFGLGEITGIELAESSPQISDEYPVTSAIGQGTHNYTTAELARYAAAIASRGNIYELSLLQNEGRGGDSSSGGTGAQGRLLRRIDSLGDDTWDAIQSGMRMAAESYSAFADFPIAVAGKTGTAQQSASRPNHALFIGYAPADEPEIAVAVRIANGYTSSNAAQAAANIFRYYFGLEEEEALITNIAEEVENVGNAVTD